jgi:hypothetical protein
LPIFSSYIGNVKQSLVTTTVRGLQCQLFIS